MADFGKFGGTGSADHCAQCESMLSDALDGILSAADKATFDVHLAGCPSCATMFADAQRGAAWMEMLKSPRPEPPASLLDRIIAETSGKTAAENAPKIVLGPTDHIRVPVPPRPFIGQPAFAAVKVPLRTRITNGFRSLGQTMLQPRLAMTAAMAFFSIALTLNLTGVRLSELRASDFKPSSIMRSASQAKTKVVQYADNLRVVYELQTRVRDLQSSSDEDRSVPQNTPPNAPAANPNGQQPSNQKQGPSKNDQKQTKPNPGSSRREIPSGNIRLAGTLQPKATSPFATQAFLVLTPSVFKQEGEMV